MTASSIRRGLAPILAFVVLFGALLPVAGAATVHTADISVPRPGADPLGPGVPASYAEPFATRAGYNASVAAGNLEVVPAGVSTLVVVTFKPTDDSLFAPPAPGAPPLSIAQVADRYGLSPAAYAGAERYFVSQGLHVVHAWPDRLALSLEGDTNAIDRAFGTTLEEGTTGGRPIVLPGTPPSLPATLQSSVAAVSGLSSGLDAFSLPLSTPVTVAGTEALPGQGGSLVTPSIARNNLYDIAGLYNLTTTPTYATGQQIAVLLWGDGFDPSDLTTFFSEYYPSSYPAPVVHAYPVDGAPSPGPGAVRDPDAKAPQELTLDIEWAGSIAVGATIDAVYAPDGPAPGYSPTTASMVDALNEAISLKPDALSMSFGTTEATDAGLRAAWDTALAAAAQSGIALLAATGDTGGAANSGCAGGPGPEYPSTNPEVIAVGGTDVSYSTNLFGQISGFTETGWSLSGGGFSAQYPAPAWQTAAIPSSESGGARGIPDVSASAALDLVYYNGQPLTAAGTSFATPLWAGLLTEMDALHGRSLGFLPPRLYAIGLEEPSGKIGQGLADITSGSNCVASAGPGWDAVTGWGSPRGVTFYEELTATFVNLSISTSATAVTPGGAVTISAHLANATNGAAIAGVPVLVSLAADTDLGPCVGVFGTSAPATDPAGNVTVTIAVPSCYLGSHAVAQVIVTSDGFYGTNATSVGVDLLAFSSYLEGVGAYPENVLAYVAIMGLAIAIGGAIGARLPGHPPVRKTVRRTPSMPPSTSGPGPPAPPVLVPAGPSAGGSTPTSPVRPPPPGPSGRAGTAGTTSDAACRSEADVSVPETP